MPPSFGRLIVLVVLFYLSVGRPGFSVYVTRVGHCFSRTGREGVVLSEVVVLSFSAFIGLCGSFVPLLLSLLLLFSRRQLLLRHLGQLL